MRRLEAQALVEAQRIGAAAVGGEPCRSAARRSGALEGGLEQRLADFLPGWADIALKARA
jgi:hypothetical protein